MQLGSRPRCVDDIISPDLQKTWKYCFLCFVTNFVHLILADDCQSSITMAMGCFFISVLYTLT